MSKTNTHKGWYLIGGKKHYYKSMWEVNYARYLEWLKVAGEILDWEYEPEIFWFEKIKRGTNNYTPDFKIYNKDETTEFHEVKGYMDAKSATKIKRMAKYHPDTKLLVIEKDAYKSVIKYERLFPQADII